VPLSLDTLYRIADWSSPLWVNPNRSDGRWNRAGQTTQYLCFHPSGPWAEFAKREHLWVDDYKHFKHRLWALRVDVSSAVTVDFDSASTHGITAEELVGDDWGPCQELADRLRAADVEMIVVPSAALPGTRNLVIFGPRVSSPYLRTPIDEVDLPTAIAADDASAPVGVRWKVCEAVANNGELAAWHDGTPYEFTEPDPDAEDDS